MVGLVPLIRSNVHLKSFNELSCIDKVLLSKIKLSDFRVMSGDLLVVGSADLRRLACNQLNSSVPLSSTDGSFNGFTEDSSLNEMLDGEIELLLGLEPVTPFLL